MFGRPETALPKGRSLGFAVCVAGLLFWTTDGLGFGEDGEGVLGGETSGSSTGFLTRGECACDDEEEVLGLLLLRFEDELPP